VHRAVVISIHDGVVRSRPDSDHSICSIHSSANVGRDFIFFIGTWVISKHHPASY